MKKVQVTIELPDDFLYWDCAECPFGYTEYFEDYDGDLDWMDHCVLDDNVCPLEEQRVLDYK